MKIHRSSSVPSQIRAAMKWLANTYAFASASGAMPGPDPARAMTLENAMRHHREGR